MKPNELEGKVALVTGASRGLGRSMSVALANYGAHVVLVGRDKKCLAETADEIAANGGKSTTHQVDVTQPDQVKSLTESVISQLGTLHILINNAGINNRKHLVEFSYEEWQEILNTNLTSAFLVSNAFVPHMIKNNWGRVINMTSILSHVGLPGRTGYCTTKAGLLGFTKALAMELAGNGITVNGISPGPHATEMNKVILDDPERNKAFLARIPTGAWGQVEDIGELAAFLCSDAAKFITGTDIVADGGWLAQ